VNDLQGALPIQIPDDLKDYGFFEEYDLTIHQEFNIPPQESSLWLQPDMTDYERNEYWELRAILKEYNYHSGAKLFGHPEQIQGCVLYETVIKKQKLLWYGAEKVTDPKEFDEINKKVIEESKEWRILLEFDPCDFKNTSNYKGVFNDYMSGRFYLLIRKNDLENMKFDNVESIYQTT
jgi:uncharacterized protein YwqG